MEAATLMDWLVDTNILIDHLRGVSKATTFLRQVRNAGTLWISAVTVAEVYAGQRTRQAKQAAKVSRLLNLFRIAYVDGVVAKLGGEIARDCGTALPDALIAATAVRKGLVLATRNMSHFQHIPDLDVRAPY
jgi:predicted nucleic acid-binding protein